MKLMVKPKVKMRFNRGDGDTEGGGHNVRAEVWMKVRLKMWMKMRMKVKMI